MNGLCHGADLDRGRTVSKLGKMFDVPMMDSRGVRQSLVRRGRSFDKAYEVQKSSKLVQPFPAWRQKPLRFVLLVNTEDIRLLK